MKSIRSSMFHTLAVAAALCCANLVRAAEHTMKGDDAYGASSFNTGAQWDDGQAPKAGETYVANRMMRTPTTGSHTFAGDLLTVTGTVMWKGPDGTSITVPAMILRGAINNGQGQTTARIYGNITIPADASAVLFTGTEPDRRLIHIYATLAGSGALELRMPRPTDDLKEIALRADNTTFTGPVTMSGTGKLTLFDENNLGGNPPAWNPQQLMIRGAVLRVQNTLTLDDPNRGIWLDNVTDSATHATPGGRFEIARDTTTTIDCLIGGEGPFEKTDPGTLILTATNTFTGPTIVSAGALLINSTTNASPTLSVATGAALGGTGTVYSAVAFASGAGLALAGNGYGTLTLAHAAGVTLDAAEMSFDLRAPADGASDCLALGGPLALLGAGSVTIAMPESGLPPGSYPLITYPSYSGDGTLALTVSYPNVSLAIGATAITLEVTGSGTVPRMIWWGNAAANTWDFLIGNWLPADASFSDGADVLFDDSGVASVPVLLATDVTPRDITLATTNNAYTLDTDNHTLTARYVAKLGAAALTLKGRHQYNILNVGQIVGSTYEGGGTLTLDGTLAIGTVLTVRPGANTFSQLATAVIEGPGDITLGSSADLRGTNTFDGTATLGYADQVKTFTLYNDRALGSTVGGTVLRGGTSSSYNRLRIADGVTVTDEPLTVTGGSGRRAGLWSLDGGTACRDGDILIAADGQLQIGSANGSTFTIGSLGRTVITNVGTVTVSFRDAGTVILNSRLAMPTASFNRDDRGTLVIRSSDNKVTGIWLPEGTIRLEADAAFVTPPTLAIGKGANNVGNKATLDLNGRTLALSRITDQHWDAFDGGPNEGYQRILCDTPSTLILNGNTASRYTYVGSIMSGPLTFIKDGSGTLTLGQTNALSGAVVVSNGVLAVTATGSLGLNAVQVVVAGGTLSLSNNTALCDAAAVTFAENGTGVIDLPNNVNVTVDTLWFGDKQRPGGTYGAPGSGAQRTDASRFSGTGLLIVRRGNGGTVMLLN